MGLKIKICGITSSRDAAAGVGEGADALGFMFYEKSPRFITAGAAREIIGSVPRAIRKVGVFVNASSCVVWETIEATGIDTLQFHGEEPPEFCRSFGLPVLKAFRIKDETSLKALAGYDQETWLLDSFVPGTQGGTGARFNWDLAVKAKESGRPLYLAGGLTPGNVAEAVAKVRPDGVDVSSGVEASPGVKDPEKIRAFIRAARGAES